SGESIDCLVKRPKQYETYRGDLAGTQFAEVEVDTGTGVVRVVKLVSVNDCGIVVNPLTTQSQVIGAMIQGASWALFENRLLDRNVGTMVNPNLEWYKVLTPSDMFEAQSILTPVANLGNNTSTAGIGEPPIVPTLAAVANAAFNPPGPRLPQRPRPQWGSPRSSRRWRRSRTPSSTPPARASASCRSRRTGCSRPCPRLGGLEMNRFELVRAASAAQAKELFAAKSGAVYKAGGVDVLDHLKEHLVEPPRLVDLKTIPGLDQINVEGDGSLRIGPPATLAKGAPHAGGPRGP